MRVNFFGPDPAYHEARRRFVFKGKPPPQESRAPNRAAVEPVPWFLSLGEARPAALVSRLFHDRVPVSTRRSIWFFA